MIVVLSQQAEADMEDVAAKWQPHVTFTVKLLESDPFPDIILERFNPRGQIQVKTVEVTRMTIPRVYRIKFVDPDSEKELADKKGIGPYRILYCVSREIVFVGGIANKEYEKPYSMHYLNGIIRDFREYKRQNRSKKKKGKQHEKPI
jgi:hypothetical protein